MDKAIKSITVKDIGTIEVGKFTLGLGTFEAISYFGSIPEKEAYFCWKGQMIDRTFPANFVTDVQHKDDFASKPPSE